MKKLLALLLTLVMTGGMALAIAEDQVMTPYEYYAVETLPKIYIETENGMALDDPSLVSPDERKGMGGMLPVYNYVSAAISVTDCEGFELDDVEAQVKIRGNYTSAYPKRPIRIKFSEKQAMCGLNEGKAMKSWVLLAEYKDASLLRNSAALYLANSLYSFTGNYASDFRNVEVYLNGEYNGLYVLAEQQQVNKNRVNVPEPQNPEKVDMDSLTEEELAALKDGHIGYFIEYDGYYTNEAPSETFTIRYDAVTRLGGETLVIPYADNSRDTAVDYTALLALMNGQTADTDENREENALPNIDISSIIAALTNGAADSDEENGASDGSSFGGADGVGPFGGMVQATGFTIKSDLYFEEQNAFIQHTMQTVWDVLYDAVYTDHSDLAAHPYHTMDSDGNDIVAPDITTAYDAVASVVDVDSLIDMFIIQEVCQDNDLGFSSFFFSIDMSPEGNHLLTYTAPWDFDSGFTYLSEPQEMYVMKNKNPWLLLFCDQDWFWQRVCDRWDEAKNAGVFTGLLEMVDTLSQVNEDSYEQNLARWPASGFEERNANLLGLFSENSNLDANADVGSSGDQSSATQEQEEDDDASASYGGSSGGQSSDSQDQEENDADASSGTFASGESSISQAEAASALHAWLETKLEITDRSIHEMAGKSSEQ